MAKGKKNCAESFIDPSTTPGRNVQFTPHHFDDRIVELTALFS